tara:strand:- start:206 stop:454 length:249 start_codon:yes stop_codon:yes gene_type:complete
MAKGEKKIQTMIPIDIEIDLNRIINAVSLERNSLISQPQYVRELIINHIKSYNGDQKSFVSEVAKKILEDFEKTQTQIESNG